MKYVIDSLEALQGAVDRSGLLPMFRCRIPGFSVEEMCAPECWFAPETDGPWEWKGMIASRKSAAYGKFFSGKAGFVSREWFSAFCAARRDGMDFEEYFMAGLCPRADQRIMDAFLREGSATTPALKRLCPDKAAFSSAVTRLMMRADVTISDFEYSIDRHGAPYGWGIARYAPWEAWLGSAAGPGHIDPETARADMLAHLRALLPDCPERALTALVK